MPRAAVVCISHGGGPMPVLGDPGHAAIISSLKNRVPKILKLGTPEAPRAIVVVTAHWSQGTPTISSGARHDLYYDYGGWSREAYSLKYDAPGSPDVAHEIKQALELEGFEPALNPRRGWDHGVFVPLLLINTAADIPVIQLSVLASEDVAQHLRMGRALARLRDSNVAILGSGSPTFHNPPAFRVFFGRDTAAASRIRRQVREWNTVLNSAMSGKNAGLRARALEKWRDFPHSYDMHPRGGGEHFMPLLVCVGAGGDEETRLYSDDYLGIDSYTYYWGDIFRAASP